MNEDARQAGRTCPIPGYIFIGEDNGLIPEAYRAKWADAWGFFALITPTHCSGHYPVTFASYVRAADAYSDFIEKTNQVGDLSEMEQAEAQTFIAQIGLDPQHPSIPSLIDATCRAMEERMYAHARYEESKRAWEDASRDAQTIEEIHAREQAFAAALEDTRNSTHTTVAAKNTASGRTKHSQLRLVCT